MDIKFIQFCAKMYAKHVWNGDADFKTSAYRFSRQAKIGLATAENLIDIELNAIDMDLYIDKIPGVEVDYVY